MTPPNNSSLASGTAHLDHLKDQEIPHLPHLMLDLETLGTGDDAQIIQIGAVLFCPDQNLISTTQHYFEVNVRLDDPQAGKADAGTAMFWMELLRDDGEEQRGKYAHQRAFDQRHARSMEEACKLFFNFCQFYRPDTIWGAENFDQRILRQAFERCGVPWPFAYNAERDFRTLRDASVALGVPEPLFVGTRHVAGDDAFHDAGWAILIMRRMNQIRTMLQNIHQADRTEEYEYGEPTPNGHNPMVGERFLTPKEIARQFLSSFPSDE